MRNKKYIVPFLVVLISISSLFIFAGTAWAITCGPGDNEPGCTPVAGPPPTVPATNPGPTSPGTPAPTNPPTTPGTPATMNPTPILLKNPLTVNSIEELLALILQIIIIFAVPIIVFFIIYSGFLYVTAQGKPDQITKATKAFTWTIIGAVIVLGAQILLVVITNTVKSLM